MNLLSCTSLKIWDEIIFGKDERIITMFKRKKKKTGIQTPKFSYTTPPPPPTSGSNAVKPNPNYVPPASVKTSCLYELPCGWCTKWDKKCDKKIGPERGQRVNINPVGDAIDEPIGIIVNKICKSDSDHEWECCGVSSVGSDFICRKCYAHKTIPHRIEKLETHFT
jgi:hypothetical protein